MPALPENAFQKPRLYPEVYDNFAGKPNGSLVGRFADSEQAYFVTGNVAPVVEDGKLIQPLGVGNFFDYSQLPLSANCTHIGCEYTMQLGSTANGNLAMLIPETTIAGAPPNAGLHVAIGTDTIGVGYLIGGALTLIDVVGIPVHYTDGRRPNRIDAVTDILGTSIYVCINGRMLGPFSDANVSAIGPFAVWEHLTAASQTDNRASILKLWADCFPAEAQVVRLMQANNVY